MNVGASYEHWPLFGLEVRIGEMTLRYPDDDLLVELVRLAAHGIHDPSTMPFAVPWTRHDSPTLEREALRFHWQCRVDTRPGNFRIPLVAIVGGEVLGASAVNGTDFATLQQFETGSWLGKDAQGKGYGKLMRLASLTLGFDGLDASTAATGAWHDNAASLGVTRALGYSETGRVTANREGTADDQLHFQMTREHFNTIRPDNVEFFGLDAARSFLEI